MAHDCTPLPAHASNKLRVLVLVAMSFRDDIGIAQLSDENCLVCIGVLNSSLLLLFFTESFSALDLESVIIIKIDVQMLE